ncbi:hypothetical protein G6F56_006236 [Rhizopus delemar]|nr:hypothetical protein G6F56_006236 [Rhizopus delemar]
MKENCNLQLYIKTAALESLQYSIYSYSSHSGSYYPNNITVDNPTEQSSRWSSGSHDQTQYVILKLERPVVACEILFGKFHRPHVCNLKEFKVFGGLEPDNLNEVLHAGLNNNTETEAFPIRYTYDNMIFPVQYIKISPMATFGTSFNYSIWYVEVKGIKDEKFMTQIFSGYKKYKELETIKLCLKHFRQQNMMDIYYALQKKTQVEFEHPIISSLHQTLVVDGDFDKAEQMIRNADSSGVFQPYVQTSRYSPEWQRICALNDDGDVPSARGGHQMCIDPEHEKIYLIGGWDGKRDLSDFWCYDIKKQRWRLLSSNTFANGGPTARSCHQICFDSVRKSILVLGRYIEPNPNATIADLTGNTYGSDFYQYFIEQDQWVKISENTQIDGGPPLLFDLQMCVDSISRTLFVSGGRIAAPGSTAYAYGGLYTYDMDTSVWKVVRYDIHPQGSHSPPTPPNTHTLTNDQRRLSWESSNLPSSYTPTIKGRAGHSMVMSNEKQGLYIFAGQREKNQLSDLCYYSIREDKIDEIAQNFFRNYGSDIGYTQRATLDEERKELCVSIGYVCDKTTNVVKNLIWVYNIDKNCWEKVYDSKNHDFTDWNKGTAPSPRFAHHFVYNPKTKTHFIFGGNPGDHGGDCRRLDDFWELRLTKPTSSQIVRQCIYVIRAHKMYEMCKRQLYSQPNTKQTGPDRDKKEDTLGTLNYLRKYIEPLIDYENKEEVCQLEQLCAHICLPKNDEDFAKNNPKANAEGKHYSMN